MCFLSCVSLVTCTSWTWLSINAIIPYFLLTVSSYFHEEIVLLWQSCGIRCHSSWLTTSSNWLQLFFVAIVLEFFLILIDFAATLVLCTRASCWGKTCLQQQPHKSRVSELVGKVSLACTGFQFMVCTIFWDEYSISPQLPRQKHHRLCNSRCTSVTQSDLFVCLFFGLHAVREIYFTIGGRPKPGWCFLSGQLRWMLLP